MRTRDVANLMDAYAARLLDKNATGQISFEILTNLLAKKGISLRNPIAIDDGRPSYRVIGREDSQALPGAVVIEENDNVDDPKNRVRGYGDGSIKLEKKSSTGQSVTNTK
jgi:hypothetical protein